MSKCPFWSTQKQRVECYGECPMLAGELRKEQDDESCIFHECTSTSNSINFKEAIKEDYSFLNFSIYDEEKLTNISY